MVQRSNDGEPESAAPLEAAAKRLKRAVSLLENHVTALSGLAESGAGGLFDQDRSKLAAELDAARARERALEEAGAEASLALGRAIEGVRRALDQAEGG